MLRWTDEQLADYQARLARKHERPAAKPVRAKYRNKKTEICGVKFDSNAEAMRFVQLCRMQEAGLISNLRRQVAFELAPAVKIPGKSRMSPPLRYFADFTYDDQDGKRVIEDVKGQERVTEGYRIKRHLLALQGHTINEIRKSAVKSKRALPGSRPDSEGSLAFR